MKARWLIHLWKRFGEYLKDGLFVVKQYYKIAQLNG